MHFQRILDIYAQENSICPEIKIKDILDATGHQIGQHFVSLPECVCDFPSQLLFEKVFVRYRSSNRIATTTTNREIKRQNSCEAVADFLGNESTEVEFCSVTDQIT